MSSVNNIARFREERGWSRPKLAALMATTPQQVERLEKGQRQLKSSWIDRAATAFGVDPAAIITPAPDENGAPPRVVSAAAEPDDSVAVVSIDLAYGMGGTFIEHDAISVDKLRFSRGWLRNFTPAAPDSLFVARGIGDSMSPTIQDSDIVLVDRTQMQPRMADQIWAFAFGDVGMIKRLRPRPDGTISILSDNPNVPEDRASDGELHIVGRVVAVVRKV